MNSSMSIPVWLAMAPPSSTPHGGQIAFSLVCYSFVWARHVCLSCKRMYGSSIGPVELLKPGTSGAALLACQLGFSLLRRTGTAGVAWMDCICGKHCIAQSPFRSFSEPGYHVLHASRRVRQSIVCSLYCSTCI